MMELAFGNAFMISTSLVGLFCGLFVSVAHAVYMFDNSRQYHFRVTPRPADSCQLTLDALRPLLGDWGSTTSSCLRWKTLKTHHLSAIVRIVTVRPTQPRPPAPKLFVVTFRIETSSSHGFAKGGAETAWDRSSYSTSVWSASRCWEPGNSIMKRWFRVA
jgi:hypothetical protein